MIHSLMSFKAQRRETRLDAVSVPSHSLQPPRYRINVPDGQDAQRVSTDESLRTNTRHAGGMQKGG